MLMKADAPITLSRDCDGVMIRSGEMLNLAAGSQVWLTQSLGGSFTVMTDRGYLARIDGKDADTLGLQDKVLKAAETAGGDGGSREIEK